MMDGLANPLMNPDFGNFTTPDAEAEANVQTNDQFEGRTGVVWTHSDLNDSLKRLIHVCREGQEAYLQAAEHVKSAWLQGLFQSFSDQREQFTTELSNLAEGYGVLDTGTSVVEVLHQVWVDLRNAVAGGSVEDAAILEECERAEDHAKETYETELNKGLPEHVHRVVQSQYQDIMRAHDQIREARDAFVQ